MAQKDELVQCKAYTFMLDATYEIAYCNIKIENEVSGNVLT